jgi:hypothetical protein
MFLLFFTKKINLQVRPIFDVLNNASSKWFKMDGKYSVDEMMVPYFGRHSSKQFIFLTHTILYLKKEEGRKHAKQAVH